MATAQVLINPASRDCRELGTVRAENEVGGPVAEYSAGEVVMVKAQVPKVEGGVFKFYLCPEVDPETEECLIKVPLKLAVGQGVEIDLTKMSQGGLYEIPLILPEDVACESCTLLGAADQGVELPGMLYLQDLTRSIQRCLWQKIEDLQYGFDGSQEIETASSRP